MEIFPVLTVLFIICWDLVIRHLSFVKRPLCLRSALLDGEIIFINVPSAQIFILHTNKSQGTKNEKQALITACLAVIIKALLKK